MGRKGEVAEAAPVQATNASGLTEYELQRAAHIRRNMEYMARLGIAGAAEAMQAQNAAPKEVKRKKKLSAEELGAREIRRSSRLLGQEAENAGGLDMAESSDDDENAPRPAKKRGAPSVPGRDIVEDAREWLAQTRLALLEVPEVSPGSKGCKWQAEAIRRWGDKVVCSGDWETFVRSRLSTPPPPSPHELLQEFYAHDPYQLLCACALMSRVSSWAVKHVAISGFFEKYPTPSAFLDANPEEVQTLLHPLGLFPTRMQTLVAVTRRFLEAPLFSVGLEPELKVYGIGQFGVDSYRLFCRGDLKCNPDDCNLKRFVEWQRGNAAATGAGAAGAGAASPTLAGAGTPAPAAGAGLAGATPATAGAPTPAEVKAEGERGVSADAAAEDDTAKAGAAPKGKKSAASKKRKGRR